MKIAAVIPVRMGSSRFPGKPLTLINGRTMVEHVYQRTALCPGLEGGVYVATPDEEIAEAARSFGAQVAMTSASHTRASDRVAEAAEQLDADIVVMIQGDEPLITPDMVELSFQPLLENNSIFSTNLVKRIRSEEEYRNPNTIKVAMDHQMNALYFSREPIPTTSGTSFDRVPAFKQVCIIAYPKTRLLEFAKLEPTELEVAESIDMLRILQHGGQVKMIECTQETHSVDVLADVAVVETMMEGETISALYR